MLLRGTFFDLFSPNSLIFSQGCSDSDFSLASQRKMKTLAPVMIEITILVTANYIASWIMINNDSADSAAKPATCRSTLWVVVIPYE